MANGKEAHLPELVAVLLVGVAGAISVPLYFTFGQVTWAFAVIWGTATLASVTLVPAVRRSGQEWERKLRVLALLAGGLGIVSIATGIGNNATDEPFTMAGYLSVLLHGHDPYTTAVGVTYTARTLGFWSLTVSSQFHYIYLPLLLFFQVPGTGVTGYRAMCLACWAGILYLVRKDRFAALCLVSPVVALLAANGFTDLPPLLLITFSLRGGRGASGRLAEYASYAMKQFANVFWFAYHLARRQVLRAVLVLVLTLVLVSPFLLWHPAGIWCEALTFSLSPGCAGASDSSRQISDLYSHWNYYLWILWAYALFHEEIHRFARSMRARLRPSNAAQRTGADPAPSSPTAHPSRRT